MNGSPMQTVELKSSPELKAVILAAFPGYRKLKSFVSGFDCAYGVNVNSFWDGGSRSEYVLIHIPTLTRKALPTSTHPYFDIARAGVTETANKALSVDHVGNVRLMYLPSDFALVEAGISCGKAATAHVHIGSDALAMIGGR